jgi:pilus assembly protein Flp/PilA
VLHQCKQSFTNERYEYAARKFRTRFAIIPSMVLRKKWNVVPMKNLLKNFVADESGATAIEYGLIAAGISLAIISVVNGLGTKLNAKFASINNSLK